LLPGGRRYGTTIATILQKYSQEQEGEDDMSNSTLQRSSEYRDGYVHGIYASEDMNEPFWVWSYSPCEMADWLKGYEAGRAQRGHGVREMVSMIEPDWIVA
jgi:hypothetical protein